jgi:hypothetical protein
LAHPEEIQQRQPTATPTRNNNINIPLVRTDTTMENDHQEALKQIQPRNLIEDLNSNVNSPNSPANSQNDTENLPITPGPTIPVPTTPLLPIQEQPTNA